MKFNPQSDIAAFTNKFDFFPILKPKRLTRTTTARQPEDF